MTRRGVGELRDPEPREGRKSGVTSGDSWIVVELLNKNGGVVPYLLNQVFGVCP